MVDFPVPARADMSGCMARLTWAERGLSELNGIARRHSLLVGVDGEPLQDKSALLMEASLLASNIVHQLRSALDNLVLQLARLNDAEPNPSSSFPLRFKDNKRSDDIIARKLSGLKDDHIQAIRRCQPYHGLENHPLKFLEDLWNSDKHNVLMLVEARSGDVKLAGHEFSGESLYYPDGKDAVGALRTSLAAVAVVLTAFAPAFDGGRVEMTFDHMTVNFWREYFRIRDPNATYLDDLELLVNAVPTRDYLTASSKERARLLAAVQRLLCDPIFFHRHRAWLSPLGDRLRSLGTDNSE